MPQDNELKIVTIDEGDGPSKAIKDPSGRILSAEQLDSIRQQREVELHEAGDLKDKLAAGDTEAIARIVGPVKDGLRQRLTQFDKQKADVEATLAKLEAGDSAAVADVVGRMVQQLDQRMQRTTEARDRYVEAMQKLAAK